MKKKPAKSKLPLEGERYEWPIRFNISNIVITKDAFVQRLDDKVGIVIQCKDQTEAENLVTSFGAQPAP